MIKNFLSCAELPAWFLHLSAGMKVREPTAPEVYDSLRESGWSKLHPAELAVVPNRAPVLLDGTRRAAFMVQIGKGADKVKTALYCLGIEYLGTVEYAAADLADTARCAPFEIDPKLAAALRSGWDGDKPALVFHDADGKLRLAGGIKRCKWLADNGLGETKVPAVTYRRDVR